MAETKSKKCRYCENRGYQRNNEKKIIELCSCIKKKCACSEDNNYLYLDKKDGIFKQCACKNYRMKITRINNIFKTAEIPFGYKWKFIEDIDMLDNNKKDIPNIRPLIDVVDTVIENYPDIRKRRGVVFWSELTGSGKTLAASIILNTLIFQHGITGKFIKLSSDYFGALKNTYSSANNEREADIIKKLINYEVLVIDDFGTHRSTDWENEKLYELIDGRNDYKKLTIITTNNNFEKIEEKALYDRILSRLMEMCIFFNVKTPCFRSNFLIKK